MRCLRQITAQSNCARGPFLNTERHVLVLEVKDTEGQVTNYERIGAVEHLGYLGANDLVQCDMGSCEAWAELNCEGSVTVVSISGVCRQSVPSQQ